jgi:TetR/AcrR family transcriptional regulator
MGIAERREREKEQRRRHIIDSAEAVFFSRGFAAATMDAIAQKAELSRGTLYLYFKDKDDVHKEIVSKGMNTLHEILTGKMDERTAGITKLEIIWDALIRFSRDYPAYLDAFMHYENRKLDVSSEKDVEKWLDRYKVIRLTLSALETGASDGSIRSDMSPRLLTLLFWTQIMGAIQFVRFKNALIQNLLDIQPAEFLDRCRQYAFQQLKAQ